MRVDEAKKLCPELVCVHVETLKDKEEDPGGDRGTGAAGNANLSNSDIHGEGGTGSEARGGGGSPGPSGAAAAVGREEGAAAAGGPSTAMTAAAVSSELGTAHDRTREKASLERYRRESRKVRGGRWVVGERVYPTPALSLYVFSAPALRPHILVIFYYKKNLLLTHRFISCYINYSYHTHNIIILPHMQILQLLHESCPRSVLEKASIDEMYIDVTEAVEAEMAGRGGRAPLDASPDGLFSW
jgi:hypothetical protein